MPYWGTETLDAAAAVASQHTADNSIYAQLLGTVASLRAASVGVGTVYVAGYYAALDGGGGAFYWDNTDTTTADNGGTCIVPTNGGLAATGRWKRIWTGPLNTRWFGVNPSQSDNTQAMQNAITFACVDLTHSPGATLIGQEVFTPAGYHRFSFDMGTSGLSTITINADNVRITGEGSGTQFTVRGSTTCLAITTGASTFTTVVAIPTGKYRIDTPASGVQEVVTVTSVSGFVNTISGTFVHNHASGTTSVTHQVSRFFTVSQATRGNGGGAREIQFEGNSQLEWCFYQTTWRKANYWRVTARDVFGGIWDGEATVAGVLGESMTFLALDYVASSGTNSCLSQYVVQFRPNTSGGTWTDCSTRDIFGEDVWNATVVCDGTQRNRIDNTVAAWNATSANTIDATSRAGCLHAVIVTNSITSSSTNLAGANVIDGVYLESHQGSETTATNSAVYIDSPATHGNTYNEVYNVTVANTSSALLTVKNTSGTTGLTQFTTFRGNKGTSPMSTGQIVIGAGVTDTDIWLATKDAVAGNVSDSGTRTSIASVGTSVQFGTLAVSVKDPAYGAKGDGSTDDSTALQAAGNAWIALVSAGKNAKLLFPPGVYNHATPITLVPTGTITSGSIEGYGATLNYTGTGATVSFALTTVGATHTCSGVKIRGFDVKGAMQLRASTYSVYGISCADMNIYGIGNIAPLDIPGVFESEFTNLRLNYDSSVTPTTAAQSCLTIRKESTYTQPSSIVLNAIVTRGGYNGISSPNAADVRCYGLTLLAAQQEGMYLQGQGLVVNGVHAEDNSMASGANAAGVRVEGSGTVSGVFGYADTGASQAPYSGSTSQTQSLRTYVFGTNVAGSTVAGSMVVSDIQVVSNVSNAVAHLNTGGANNSQLIRNGGVVSNGADTAIPFGRSIDVQRIAPPPTLIATGGETTMDALLATSAGITMVSQRLQLTYFTALKTETISQIAVNTGGTAAAATPTVCVLSVFTVDASDNLSQVAVTTNDTTLFAAANTRYTKAFTASFTKQAGQRYAVGSLVVTAAAAPTLCGASTMVGSGLSLNTLPRRQGRVASQATMPTSETAGSVTVDGNSVYAELLP